MRKRAHASYCPFTESRRPSYLSLMKLETLERKLGSVIKKWFPSTTPSGRPPLKATRKPNEPPLDADAKRRYQRLRTWRTECAKAREIPAFFVFSDRTLRELARRAPRDRDELAEVYGVGPHK